jgi:dTMP kinase
MHKGFFITLEGIDGVGKTLQINLLLDELKKSYPVYFTKEPGDKNAGSSVGPGIREILFKNPGTEALGPGVGDLLFLADHLQNVYDIRKALEEGKVVVSDRYADSQFAYAASPSKKAPAWANKLFVDHYGVTPDLTLLLVARGTESLQASGEPGGTGRYRSVPKEDIGWALRRANARRGAEAGKQDGKAWNEVEAQRTIQYAYLTGLVNKPRTRIINVWEENTPDQIADQIKVAVLLAIAGQTQDKQPNLPLMEPVQAISKAA